MSQVWHYIVSDGEATVLKYGEWGVSLHNHYSQLHSDLEWQNLFGPYIYDANRNVWAFAWDFANSLGDLGSILGRVIPKTLKMALDTSLLNNIRYVSRVKWSNPGKGVVPPLHLSVVAIEKGAFWSPSTMVAGFTFLLLLVLNRNTWNHLVVCKWAFTTKVIYKLCKIYPYRQDLILNKHEKLMCQLKK